jgi:hypothetical protein
MAGLFSGWGGHSGLLTRRQDFDFPANGHGNIPAKQAVEDSINPTRPERSDASF